MIYWCVGTWQDWQAFAVGKPTLSHLHFAERHPREFSDQVQALQAAFAQETQHVWVNNSLILDGVSAESVLVLHGGKSRPLTEHPDYGRWKAEMLPGEFWSLVGEAWVSEGD